MDSAKSHLSSGLRGKIQKTAGERKVKQTMQDLHRGFKQQERTKCFYLKH